jgi:diguanylate cyclase (GGDEF)-like protein/PAS domain S-box-containing protein
MSQVQVRIKSTDYNRSSLDFINFIRLQEKAAQERGVLNGILHSKQVDISQLQQTISYGDAQDRLIADLFSISETHHQQWLSKQLSTATHQQVLAVRLRLNEKLARQEKLYNLEHGLGYAGVIHHFKNYILRGEKQYIEKFNSSLVSVSKNISAFKQLNNLTQQELESIQVLESTINHYRQNLLTAQRLKKEGLAIHKIDVRVRLDDTAATFAISQLQQYEINVTSHDWWQLASEHIDLFREVSDHIRIEMSNAATDSQRKASVAMFSFIGIFIVAFLFVLSLSFTIVKRIVQRIEAIADAMKQMQIDHKFNLPLTVDGIDEVAEMATAFNQMLAERKKSESELKISAAVFKYASEAIMITNEDNIIETVNPAFCIISGYKALEVIGKSPNVLSSGKHTANFYHSMYKELEKENSWQGEIWNKRKNGEIYPEFLAISVVRDTNNKPIQYISLFSDITKHKKYEEDIWLQANYDSLTGLPNRKMCLERLHFEVNDEKSHSNQLALMFIDLDRFKNVNDTWGHNSGDELLKLVALRLKNCTRESDTVARFGGDEFVVILAKTINRLDIERIAKNILNTLSAPFILSSDNRSGTNEAVVSASIGITLSPTDGSNAEVLLKNADTAMYQAKESGRNGYKFFTSSMNEIVTARMKVEQALRRAVKKQEFILHYQPVVSLSTGEFIGAEALIRWQHPEDGLVYPDSFIGIAEETGLIEPIGQWVIEQACQDLKHWHAIGLKIQVAVNVSSRQCKQTSEIPITHVIRKALDDNNISPSYLKIEITESLLMDNSQEMISSLQEIRDLGVGIHMDDFGTGYSSLSYLKHFPIDVLKIDRSFIEGAISDKTDASLVEAVVLIGHSLQLKLVGEGIETQQHFDYLASLGCDYGQGYFISKPIPVKDFINLCQAQLLS